ncbi:MAG: preprotein translocase subunit SecG [Firmicutes bacterium]|nr:preprotein translocase subunit SecG [Bacillota bacterium]
MIKSLLLADDSVMPSWLLDTLLVLKDVFIWGLAIGAIAMIVLVLVQQSNSQGGAGAAITGVTETYYSQNKGRNKEGRLKLATTVLACVMGSMAVLYFVIVIFVPG